MPQAPLLAIIAGCSAGVIGGYLFTKAIILWLSRSCARPGLVALLATVGALAALVPAFFLSIFVGDTLGGGFGQMTNHILGLETFGVPVGLGLGLALILAVITGCGALAGAAIARFIAARHPPRAVL